MTAERKYCTSICAQTVWATPSTIPPTSVPHSEPMPPITTASNAKISCVGPPNGSKVDAHRVEDAGERRDRHRDRRRAGVHRPRVDADELRSVGIRRRRAQLAADLRAPEQQVQAAEHGDRDRRGRARRTTGS